MLYRDLAKMLPNDGPIVYLVSPGGGEKVSVRVTDTEHWTEVTVTFVPWHTGDRWLTVYRREGWSKNGPMVDSAAEMRNCVLSAKKYLVFC